MLGGNINLVLVTRNCSPRKGSNPCDPGWARNLGILVHHGGDNLRRQLADRRVDFIVNGWLVVNGVPDSTRCGAIAFGKPKYFWGVELFQIASSSV
jgi:hypothetical protein